MALRSLIVVLTETDLLLSRGCNFDNFDAAMASLAMARPGYDVKLCPAVPPLLAALGGLAAGRASGCKKLARHPP